MKVTPFRVPGINQQNTPMGIDLHVVPGVHALFFGPVECARHTFPQLVADPDGSILVVDDVQASLGATEDLVREAVAEISGNDPGVRAFVLCTACQTAFMGIDLEGLCLDLHAETGLFFGHLEANRMAAENIPGKSRRNIPGGDRYHSRLVLFRMLRQAPEPAGEGGGVLFLTADALDGSNEVLRLAEQVEGVEWVRGVGDCASFDEFLGLRGALVTVATSTPWREVGEWMEQEFGIPMLYLPTSYSLDEVDGYYGELAAVLAERLGPGARQGLEAFSRAREEARAEALAAVRGAREGARPLDLDLRLVNRPFSLVETLQGYGFPIHDFVPGVMQVLHKEADDLPAFERLREKDPMVGVRFSARPNSSARKKRGTRTKNLQRAGRWVEVRNEYRVERVPEETAWWGYASVRELMRQLRQAGDENPQGRSTGNRGRWSL